MDKLSTTLLVGGVSVAGAFVAGTRIGATKRLLRKLSAVPEDYVIPEVWTYEEGQMLEGTNRPFSGPRKEQELKRGEHALQLYSLGTPNGCKATILLEELHDSKGVEYDAWKISFSDLDQFGSGFVALNPNSKIPTMLDTDTGIRVFETGSLLKYLSEKYDDAFVPSDLKGKTECYNWLFWQVGGAPYWGGAGFGLWYKYAPFAFKFGLDRATIELKRQLDVLDKHLADKTYLCGAEYTIADIAVWPWFYFVKDRYGAETFLQLADYPNLLKWYAAVKQRPAVQRGIRVSGFGDDAIPERHSAKDFL